MRVLSTLILLCTVALSEEPSTQQLSEFVEFLKNREYAVTWDFFSLRLFPYLTAKHHPWTASYMDEYPEVDSTPFGSVCSITNGVYYFGSKIYLDQDSLNIYRAEKFRFYKHAWEQLEEYVIVTDHYNRIIDVFSRKNPTENFSEVFF